MRTAAFATFASLNLAYDIETLYAKYIAQFRKSYLTTEEYEIRMEIFAKNNFLIKEHNMGSTHTLAHNIYSDWTEAELK